MFGILGVHGVFFKVRSFYLMCDVYDENSTTSLDYFSMYK